MSITSKLRLARGLLANLPLPPNAFEIGRPYIATDDQSLWVGQGPNLPMLKIGVSGGVGPTITESEVVGLVADLAALNAADAALAVEIATMSAPFEFVQSTPATVWTINHNLNISPVVVIQDSTNTQVLAEINFTDNDNLQILFSGPESGQATLIS